MSNSKKPQLGTLRRRAVSLLTALTFLVLAVTLALTLLACYAVAHTPVDAIPDLSENQVIVFADWPGRSPRPVRPWRSGT